jgi:hypothetical protein
MARVRAFQIDGLHLWFWSGDHEPPHFHAKKSGQWEVKVRFLLPANEMIEVKWQEGRLSTSQLNQLRNLAEEHRVALLEEWERLRSR